MSSLRSILLFFLVSSAVLLVESVNRTSSGTTSTVPQEAVTTTTTPKNDASSGQKGGDGKGSKEGEKKDEGVEKDRGVDWIGAGYAAVLAMNLGAILFVRIGLDKLNQAKEICEQIVESTHSLAQTTVRVGVGPSTKETLAAYARENKEFQRFNKQ